MERAAGNPLLRFLPGIVRSLHIPLQRQAGYVRLRGLLVERSGATACAGFAFAFCSRFSGTYGSRAEAFWQTGAGLCSAFGAAAGAFECCQRHVGLFAVARLEGASG